MQKDIYDRIISFLQGASWGIVILGALLIFKIFLVLGLTLAIFFTVLYVIISLFLILLLDALHINRQRFEESKKQTKLLEKIYSKHTK